MKVRTLLLVLAGFVALALLRTLPLARHFATHVPGDPRDPLLIAWILSWDVHALATDPLRLFDANIFFPAERALAFSDHLLGVIPIFAPAYVATGSPVVGYNTLFVLSFALSGLSGFCLAYHLTRAFWPSVVGGTLFGFAPYRFGQVGHLQLLSFFWTPWALLFLDRFLRARRWRDLAGFAVFYWLQVLSSVYLAFMVTVAAAVYAAYHAFAVDRRFLRVAAPKLAAFGAASVAVLLPSALPYLAVNRAWSASRTLGGISGYSADVLSYLMAPPAVNDLYVALFHPSSPWPSGERALFPGLLIVALALVGSLSSISRVPATEVSRVRRAFGLMTLVAVLLSLGPFLVAFGHKTRVPLPYLLLYHAVPGWAGMRVPARFAFLAVLAAMPIATLGALKCAEALSRRVGLRPGAASVLTSAALVSLVFLELGAKPVPLVEPPAPGPVHGWLAARRPGPVVELPGDLDDEYGYVYLSTTHWLPLVNGHSSFVPRTYLEIRDALAQLPDQRAVEYARALGVAAIVVHADRLSPADRARWAAAEGGLRRETAFGSDMIYSVPPLTPGAALRAVAAAPDWLPAAQRARLGLLIEAVGGRPWRHPAPQGESEAQVTWLDEAGGRATTHATRVQFPPVIPAGETAAVPVKLRTPERAGRYRLQVTVPVRGIVTASRVVEVRQVKLGTSRDSPAGLAAAYRLAVEPPRTVLSPVERLEMEVVAVNTGQAVWLARATNDRGEVRLAWRWRRGERELREPAGQAGLRYEVFPGQQYALRLSIAPPLEPGRYTLEMGLVSEAVATFAALGTRPLAIPVEVRSRSAASRQPATAQVSW